MNGLQARAVARGFHRFVDRSGIQIFACAVMPDHCHVVVKRHTYSIEEIARKLKADATRQMSLEKIHPFADNAYRDGTLPSPWARGEWSCFLDSEKYILNAIDYTNRNPLRDHLPPQRWNFLTPFDSSRASVE